MTTFPPRRLVSELCDQLVAIDLPDLPAARRHAAVDFATHRVTTMPSPLRAGVGVVASVVGLAARIGGRRRVAGVLADHSLPGAGEYVRVLRSLVHAFVWERWPDTSPTGRPLSATGEGGAL